MQNRRGFLLTIVTGFVAMAIVVGTVIADELLGVISQGRRRGQEDHRRREGHRQGGRVKITDKTEQVSKKKGEESRRS